MHDVRECGERQFLIEHLDWLSPDDLLLLDRNYPCRWLVAVLNDRSIKFCMRVDNTSSFDCVRTFMRSNSLERVVMLSAPENFLLFTATGPMRTVEIYFPILHIFRKKACRKIQKWNMLASGRVQARRLSILYSCC